MEKVVIFNRPIWAVKEESLGKRELFEIYGFRIPSNTNVDDEKIRTDIDDYIDYLCGVSQWHSEGNTITSDGEWWINTKDAVIHWSKNKYVKNYLKRSRKQMKVNYRICETCMLESDENTDNCRFITSKRIYDYITSDKETTKTYDIDDVVDEFKKALS